MWGGVHGARSRAAWERFPCACLARWEARAFAESEPADPGLWGLGEDELSEWLRIHVRALRLAAGAEEEIHHG